MSEPQHPKWYVVLFQELLKAFPPLCLILGLVVVVWAGSNLRYGEFEGRPESDLLRYVMLAIGVVVILAGFAFYIFDRRAGAEAVAVPGPYALGRRPVKLFSEPAQPVLIRQPRQRFPITFKGPAAPAGYMVRVFFLPNDTNDVRVWFAGGDSEEELLADGQCKWTFAPQGPAPDKVNEEKSRKLAAYYVGPHGRILLDHHQALCVYFAPNGTPPWPPFTTLPTDVVRCSEVVTVRFEPAPQRSQA